MSEPIYVGLLLTREQVQMLRAAVRITDLMAPASWDFAQSRGISEILNAQEMHAMIKHAQGLEPFITWEPREN
jgi:hypothetical protein